MSQVQERNPVFKKNSSANSPQGVKKGEEKKRDYPRKTNRTPHLAQEKRLSDGTADVESNLKPILAQDAWEGLASIKLKARSQSLTRCPVFSRRQSLRRLCFSSEDPAVALLGENNAGTLGLGRRRRHRAGRRRERRWCVVVVVVAVHPLAQCPPPTPMGLEMDPLLHALSYFRRRKFQLCSDLCSQLLEKEPGDQVTKKPRAPAGQACVAPDRRTE